MSFFFSQSFFLISIMHSGNSIEERIIVSKHHIKELNNIKKKISYCYKKKFTRISIMKKILTKE
jgi:hypothetical protein